MIDEIAYAIWEQRMRVGKYKIDGNLSPQDWDTYMAGVYQIGETAEPPEVWIGHFIGD